MTETKIFPTTHVLMVVTGHSLVERGIAPVYEVLNWMTGENLFTHQLVRVAEEAVPAILKLHPELKATIAEAEKMNYDNVQKWIDTWESRYGKTLSVPKLTEDQHERIDPLSELAEKMSPGSPDRIRVVKI